jgi:hypothetical protein
LCISLTSFVIVLGEGYNNLDPCYEEIAKDFYFGPACSVFP